MKLNDVQCRPIAEVVTEMNLTEVKIHTDDDGVVRSIEMKYVPTSGDHDSKIQPRWH